MNSHSEILPGIVEHIRQADPECGVVLFGSVAEGKQRPDSDLDLFVISRERTEVRFADSTVAHEEDGMQLIRGHVQGIRVDLACWPVGPLEKALASALYLFYPISLGRILHDPDGLAQHYLGVMRDYFQENPAIVDAWVEQQEKFRRSRIDPGFRLEFPEWGGFVEHLGVMISRGVIRERTE